MVEARASYLHPAVLPRLSILRHPERLKMLGAIVDAKDGLTLSQLRGV